MTDISREAIEGIFSWNVCGDDPTVSGLILALRTALDAAEARPTVAEAAEYILDGMAIDGPDYVLPDDDNLLCAANVAWVRDTLERLATALRAIAGGDAPQIGRDDA